MCSNIIPLGGEGQAENRVRRTNELKHLLEILEPALFDFIDQADTPHDVSPQLLQHEDPETLTKRFDNACPSTGAGVEGILEFTSQVLKGSVNTWSQGFLSHLYSSTNPIGVVSELVLSILNTNVHTYETSPALTVIEKKVTRELAGLFGLKHPSAGGIVQQGGSAANLTALVTARSVLFPSTKQFGNDVVNHKFVLFTSIAGHYSLEKAAQICGLGTAAVRSVPVDSAGRMIPRHLSILIRKARSEGLEPFFVNATAGTTVLGAYDPLEEISVICKEEGMWFHVDASWGGGAIFSSQHKHKLRGSEFADSITFNPHKMLNVPITCSFLLVSDLNKLWKANTLPAGYLFHGANDPESNDSDRDGMNGHQDTWDIADMTLQCGRRGDALKMAMGWTYYGKDGYEARIDRAFSTASQLATMIANTSELALVTLMPVPCLSVCFYYGDFEDGDRTTRRTRFIANRLRLHGFAIEHAPARLGYCDLPDFLRVVVNTETRIATLNKLLETILAVGQIADKEINRSV